MSELNAFTPFQNCFSREQLRLRARAKAFEGATPRRFRPTYAEANPDFLLCGIRQNRVCGFLHGKPHEARQRHQARQEIRVQLIASAQEEP
jgi:hypothetical protein